RSISAMPASAGLSLELAALTLAQPAPDPETLIVVEGVLQAFVAHLAGGADALGVTGRATLLGEERLGIGLRAQGVGLPGEGRVLVGVGPTNPGYTEVDRVDVPVAWDFLPVARHLAFHPSMPPRGPRDGLITPLSFAPVKSR